MTRPSRATIATIAWIILGSILVGLGIVVTVHALQERTAALRLVDETLAELEQVRADADAQAIKADLERDELLERIEELTRQVQELQEQVRELGGTPVVEPADGSEGEPAGASTTTSGTDPPDAARSPESEPEGEDDPDPPSGPQPPPESIPEPSPSEPAPPGPPDDDLVCVVGICIP